MVEINAQNLKIYYGKQLALDIKELCSKGQIIGLIGHNGSGKSTLIKGLLGLVSVRNGNIFTSSQEDKSNSRLIPEQHMAYSPEDGAVFSDLSVESYIKLWCEIKVKDPLYYQHEGKRYIEYFELESLLKKFGRELSKGQRRRVQTAIGFLIRPKFFLFDEPFDGLDVEQSARLAKIIETESQNCAFLISSHRMEIVEHLADNVIVLDDGLVKIAGSVGEIARELNGSGPGESPSLVDAMRKYLEQRLVAKAASNLVTK